MKRAVSAVLALVLILGAAATCHAQAAEFDYQSVLAGRDGYEYDRAEQMWSFYKALVRSDEDGYVVVGLKAWGLEGSSALDYTELYVRILDPNGAKKVDVEAVDILVGGSVYSYKNMYIGQEDSSVPLGENGMLLIRALASCDPADVTIRIFWDTGGLKLTPDASDVQATLKEFCRVYVKYNIWDYCADPATLRDAEERFPLFVNGSRAGQGDQRESRK